jgi:protein-disulfide isomerase
MSNRLSNRTAFRRLAPAVLPALLAMTLAPGALFAAAAEEAAQVLATVEGRAITEGEVRQTAAAEFAQMEREYANNRRQLLEAKLEELVQDRLLDAEARARGLTREKILGGIAAAPVTDADVDSFYEENKASIPRPKADVAPQIKTYLEQQRQMEARTALFTALKAKYETRYLLEPIRVPVDSAGFPARGPAGAAVTVVVFSDFQCPYCSRLKPTLEQLLANYPSQVRLVFRQFPLSFHAQAQKAAEASLCANDQGKFWEMHDAMFADQSALAVDTLKAKAAQLGMNAQAFGGCLDSGEKAGRVKADLEAGTAAGVSGTPAMFLNGRFVNGAVPLEDIAKVVDDELRRRQAPAKPD